MKYILLLLMIALTASAYAQKTGTMYLPPQQPGMPEWAKMLYSKNINFFVIEKAFTKYIQEEKIKPSDSRKTETEILTGEEDEDVYTNYFKRWRKSVENYVLADGSINIPAAESILFTPTKRTESPTSAWSLIGPVETFWRANDNPTTPNAPWQVNVYCIGIAASNTNIMYAGPETGGIFKSTDKGQNWTMVTANYNISTVTALAVNPTNPDIVYGGRNNQIVKSTDGGSTWTSVTTSTGGINGFAIKPSNPDIIFAACANGIYTTTDAGTNWSLVAGTGSTCYDIMFQPGNDNRLFALQKSGSLTQCWASINGGQTFAVTTGWTSGNITSDNGGRMTVTPNDPNRIYVVLLATVPEAKPYIFTTVNTGADWAITCTGIAGSLTGNNSQPLGMSNGQGYYDLDIQANPANANEVIVATTTAYKSTNGGVSFSPLGGYIGSFGIHPDIQEITAVGNETWITTDGGINFSTDFFSTQAGWAVRTKGINASDFWGLAQGWNEDVAGGGRYHNGNTVMSENYPSGEAIRLGGGEAPTGYSMLGRPGHIAFSDINDVIAPETRNGQVKFFSFNKYPNEDGYGADASEVEFFPYCYNHIYMGEGNELWKSTNGGISWTTVYTFSDRVKKFEIARSNPNVMYLATPSVFFKTTDGGVSWSTITRPTGTSMNRLSITVSYTDENTLWITSTSNTAGNRVFKSTDGGLTWTNLTTATIDNQNYLNVLHQAGTNGGVYLLGTNGKVFYRNAAMTDWAPFNNGLPVIFSNQHVRPFYRDGKLRAAGNQGIWQVDFYEEATPVAQPTVDKLSSSCARDTFYFDDFSAFKHAGGIWAWSFPGAAYISSTNIRNPKVSYSAVGTYNFSLTVTNSAGSSSKTITGKIQVTGNECAPDTIPGKMMTLTTAGDYASQATPLNISTNTMTLSCWIKPTGNQSAFAGILFSGSGGACGLNFKNNNQLGYHWNDAPETYNWNGGPTVAADQWSHLALVINPTTVTIYLNGMPYSNSANHAVVNFTSSFLFGSDRGNTSRNFLGQMDEVCIYNRALTQQEVRELMHLTKNNPNSGSMPQVDNSLIAYYQFNEGDGKPAYDKVGINHAGLVGGATKANNSTAPVGGGVVQTNSITTGGNVNYNIPGVEMQYPASGTYPNGDVIVTRLNVPSDVLGLPEVLPANPNAYFIIRNFGANATFSNLGKIKFNNIKGTTAALATTPQQLRLFKRQQNADGNTWGTAIDSADVVTDNSGTGTVEFSTNLSLTSFGQFEIGKTNVVVPPPAPVRILTFTGTLNPDKTVTLNWTTTSETNFNGYDVEHSINNTAFNRLGFVQGTGGGAYTYLHANPVTGNNYYRLKLLYTNNTSIYSDTVLVTLKKGKGLVTISPNPVRDGKINVQFNDVAHRNVSLAVSNAAGQLMGTYYFSNTQPQQVERINTNYAPGIYFLNFGFDSGAQEKHKVVLMR